MKSGFIAILGRPNVGKSSLMNALIGQKASIVSPKAQTTRNKILGVLTQNDIQLVFVDTPGIFKPKTKLDEYMEKSVKAAVEGVDAILFVVDATKGIAERERALIEKYSALAPLYLIINKADLAGFKQIYPLLQQIQPTFSDVREVVACSAKTGENVELIKGILAKHAVEESQYFDADDFTDKPMTFMVAEIIREKALWRLNEEVPHGVGVSILRFADEGHIVRIDADIVCERASHKRIIIGDEGAKIKEIGTKAREDIEKLTQKKVFLSLFVKVRKDWRNNTNIISDLGYEKGS